MFGGKLISTGSSSCVFYPHLPCKDDENKKYPNNISKIGFGKYNDFDLEYEINKDIKKIKDYEKYFLIYNKYCKPPEYDELLKYDTDIKECIENETTKDKFNKRRSMLIGTRGGITLEDYVIKQFSPFNKRNSSLNSKMINATFLDLMKKFNNLFVGLKKLNSIDYLHLDLKCNNILLHKDKFKIIDFGLSCKISDNKKIKARSLEEYDTNRLYIPYPLEYLFLYLNSQKLDDELSRYEDDIEYRNDSNYYSLENYKTIFRKIFNRNVDDDFFEIIDMLKGVINRRELLFNMKTYSLGIIIPDLFVTEKFSTNLLKNNIIKDFFNLFKKMCEPLYKRRISLKEAHKQFIRLLNKYQKNKTKKLKKDLKKKRLTRKNKKNK